MRVDELATRLAAEGVDAVDNVLASVGFGGFAIEVLLLAGFGWISDGIETVVMSYMIPAMEDPWSLSPGQLGGASSVVSLGQALGATLWGSFADTAGRRKAFLGSLILTITFGFGSCGAQGFYSFCALRFLTGLAIGGNLPLAVSIVSEMLPPSARERSIVALQMFNEAGSLASTGLAALLLPTWWRLYLATVALPSLLVTLCASRRLPESPRWLVVQVPCRACPVARVPCLADPISNSSRALVPPHTSWAALLNRSPGLRASRVGTRRPPSS